MSGRVYGTPPPKAGPQQRVVSLDAGESIDVIILSDCPWGVGVHWNDRAGPHGRSERCSKESGECSGCNGQLPCRWKGYIHVYDHLRNRDFFLEITPGAFEQIDAQREPDKTLRGFRLRMQRGRGGAKTRLQVELQNYWHNIKSLPPAKDPEQILTMLWNWKR